MKKNIYFLTLTLLLAANNTFAQTEKESINYDDAYFDIEDLDNHPVYSSINPELIDAAKYKDFAAAKPNTKSYGQTYTDRLKNFDNYNSNPYRSYHGYYGYNSYNYGNPCGSNLWMYNVNPYFSYGPGLYSFYSPYTGVYNTMYYHGYGGFYDPNWIYYNQVFLGNNCGYNYYSNSNNYNSNGVIYTSPKPAPNPVINTTSSGNPRNNNSYGGSNTAPRTTYSGSNTTTPSTRSSNSGSSSNTWQDTRNSGSTNNSNKSQESGQVQGGSGRRR